MLNFIDLSNHQAGIDLSKLDSSAFIFKATEGKGWHDKAMPNFVRQARRLDRPIGFYHYVSQNNTPEQEASNLLLYTESNGRLDNDVLVLDWEPQGTRPSPRDVDWAYKFLDYLSDRSPNPLWTYMNLSTANGADWTPVTKLWPLLWLAHYPGSNTAQGYVPDGQRGRLKSENEWQLVAWQFTDGGRLPGWQGRLDLNELYRPWWNTEVPKPELPTVPQIRIPDIKESDAPVHLFHHHGGRINDSRGNPRLGCVCMQIVIPLVERRMLELGIIKREVDVFQGGYNKGKVAASAGTHDMGGVIDVAQGITREQRQVWADFGVIMAPRTREWGWIGGEHGHGGWFGCVHRTASLAKQVRDMMAGYNGLVSNIKVNWVSPQRTWQDVVRSLNSVVSPTPEQPGQDKEQYEMAKNHQSRHVFTHPGGGAYSLVYRDGEGWPNAIPAVPVPSMFNASAQISAPLGVKLRTRWVAGGDRIEGFWWRGLETEHHSAHVSTAQVGRVPAPVFLDIWASEPCVLIVEQQANYWEI